MKSGRSPSFPQLTFTLLFVSINTSSTWLPFALLLLSIITSSTWLTFTLFFVSMNTISTQLTSTFYLLVRRKVPQKGPILAKGFQVEKQEGLK